MENLRSSARIFLGILIAVCGFTLFLVWDPSKALPGLFNKLNEIVPFASVLAPHSIIYFKLCSVFFFIAGVLTAFNNQFAALFQMLGSFMFAITYDNPLIASKPEDKLLRCLYILCHLVIVSAIMAINETKENVPEMVPERVTGAEKKTK